ncbi:MAG: acetolactate synthase small subunit, partial [Eubacteriales bacterium]
MKSYVLSVLVKNHSGVLRRVSSLFARRGYNIESLTVGVTENPKLSRMTVVVSGDEYIVDQITKQVSKLVEILNVEILDPETSVFRELVLIKVRTTRSTRAE